MSSIQDQLPRIFQANLARLFDRVILPGMDALPIHTAFDQSNAATLNEALDRAAAVVDNYTANEASKAYTLMLAAVFERQLSIGARAVHPARATKTGKYQDLLSICAAHAGIDLGQDGLEADLMQMFIVANVVRHGEGASCEKLRNLAPELWDDDASDYRHLLAGSPIPSEHLRVGKTDLVRYIRATTRFWGLADPLPMAVIDPPYRLV
ncbi:hypothetical protein CDQ92_11355 [Sphingopyxis bauzanensis]|uniref:Uncharacterized protein n=1 Tax=Sphingopyxis bauzanensis TaxID=651663 RepID=A0A246JR26_9SPHN|nr:hypothetical protein [Sphingopyxis bauzanensis]OWQ95429.1 hypothetical protein CDQ92_11355 [Sphingopyxis bauzanensis]GGJ52852.1 hypothetical protein GCM10011393_23860 [Sphingopyxis bauzanensis]